MGSRDTVNSIIESRFGRLTELLYRLYVECLEIFYHSILLLKSLIFESLISTILNDE